MTPTWTLAFLFLFGLTASYGLQIPGLMPSYPQTESVRFTPTYQSCRSVVDCVTVCARQPIAYCKTGGLYQAGSCSCGVPQRGYNPFNPFGPSPNINPNPFGPIPNINPNPFGPSPNINPNPFGPSPYNPNPFDPIDGGLNPLITRPRYDPFGLPSSSLLRPNLSPFHRLPLNPVRPFASAGFLHSADEDHEEHQVDDE